MRAQAPLHAQLLVTDSTLAYPSAHMPVRSADLRRHIASMLFELGRSRHIPLPPMWNQKPLALWAGDSDASDDEAGGDRTASLWPPSNPTEDRRRPGAVGDSGSSWEEDEKPKPMRVRIVLVVRKSARVAYTLVY